MLYLNVFYDQLLEYKIYDYNNTYYEESMNLSISERSEVLLYCIISNRRE